MIYEKGYWLNKDSRTYLGRGYLKENQTAEERIREIADAAEGYLGIKGFADEFEDYMMRGWISLSSPVWSNFGAGRGLPIACNGSYVDDNIDSILGKTAEIGKMTQLGAGTSAYYGALRQRGSAISTGGTADGPVHYMELVSATTNIVSQGNVRRGHCAVYLPVEHPDIKEFLHLREEGSSIQNLSLGVCISDEWMHSMVNGDKDKRKIWMRIIQKRFESGYPYIFFTDNVNNGAPEVYRNNNMKIHASNMCVAGETLILTDTGYKRIDSLAGSAVSVWNGTEFSVAQVEKTGENQKLLEVTVSSGQTLKCTEYHDFYVVRNGKEVKVKANELKVSDKLVKFKLPVIEGETQLEHAYTNGFFSGDGYQESNGKARIYLYGEKKSLKPYLHTDGIWNDQELRSVTTTSGLKDKFMVPDATYSVASRVEWLAGLLDSDGTVLDNNGSVQFQIMSIEKEFLQSVQLMLQTLGVNSSITLNREAEARLMNDSKGGQALYNCKNIYRLNISSNGVYNLVGLGLNTNRLTFTTKKPNREAGRFPTITSIVKVAGTHDTFCFNEPKQHKGMFNGILTGQCVEIALPSSPDESFVCCLASLNLLHYDDWKDTRVARILTMFLDAVMQEYIDKTEGVPFMEAARRFAMRHRAIGVGVLGWHSFLQSKMIPFESVEAKELNKSMHEHIFNECLAGSKELAEILGEPELLKGYGRRNTTVMAIAPTTSSSFILGQVSPSIEPLNSNYFTKDLQKGKFGFKNPHLKALLKELGQDTKEIWDDILLHGGSVQHLPFLSDKEKAVFKTFGEIAQIEIIVQAADRQKFLDQGQSLNLMIHPEAPLKDVNLIMIEAWKQGIKSLYYQRSTNPSQELARELLSCQACQA